MSENSFDCCHEAMEVDDSSESLSQVVDAIVPMEVEDTSSSTTSTSRPPKKTKHVTFSSTVTVASYNTLTAPGCGYKVHRPQPTDFGPKKDVVAARHGSSLNPRISAA